MGSPNTRSGIYVGALLISLVALVYMAAMPRLSDWRLVYEVRDVAAVFCILLYLAMQIHALVERRTLPVRLPRFHEALCFFPVWGPFFAWFFVNLLTEILDVYQGWLPVGGSFWLWVADSGGWLPALFVGVVGGGIWLMICQMYRALTKGRAGIADRPADALFRSLAGHSMIDCNAGRCADCGCSDADQSKSEQLMK